MSNRGGGPKFNPNRPGSPMGFGAEKNWLREDRPVREEDIRPRPITGGPEDAQRVRNILQFYSQLPDHRVIYIDHTAWDEYQFAANNLPVALTRFVVPPNRTIVIDWVSFHARAVGSWELLAPGAIEQFIELHHEIGGKVPLELETAIDDPVVGTIDRAAYPFLGDRVGSTEAFFTIVASTGNEVSAYYITRAVPPVALAQIGWRFRGWLIDSSILGEILEQQR